MKDEENIREKLNASRKNFATELLPFVIADKLVSKVKNQIDSEQQYKSYNCIKTEIDNAAFASMLRKTLTALGCKGKKDAEYLHSEIKSFLSDAQWDGFTELFGLSSDDEVKVRMLLRKIEEFPKTSFLEIQERITESIERSRIAREKIQNSDIEHLEEHIKNCTKLEQQEKYLLEKIEELKVILIEKQEKIGEYVAKMKAAKKAFEDELKKKSVSAVSGRVLMLLEDLQGVVYDRMIISVEKDINLKFKELIRKDDFFTCIKIDNNFNVHILREQPVTKSDIVNLLRLKTFGALSRALGPYAILQLKEMYNVESVAEMQKALKHDKASEKNLLVEIDKERLSSGEKQIFVMSLYWSIMNQAVNNIPFVIDTPFARIDTQHRANITEHFFKKLEGQLIVLSTDEEISGEHIGLMKDQISHVYMLEYGVDKSTHIYEGKYFEV